MLCGHINMKEAISTFKELLVFGQGCRGRRHTFKKIGVVHNGGIERVPNLGERGCRRIWNKLSGKAS